MVVMVVTITAAPSPTAPPPEPPRDPPAPPGVVVVVVGSVVGVIVRVRVVVGSRVVRRRVAVPLRQAVRGKLGRIAGGLIVPGRSGFRGSRRRRGGFRREIRGGAQQGGEH